MLTVSLKQIGPDQRLLTVSLVASYRLRPNDGVKLNVLSRADIIIRDKQEPKRSSSLIAYTQMYSPWLRLSQHKMTYSPICLFCVETNGLDWLMALRACVRARVCVCGVCVCVRACVRAY